MDNGTCPEYESSLSLSLSPSSNATLATSNCTDSDSGYQWTEDACIDSLHLLFAPGQCEVSVSVRLRQDFVLEGPESLLLYATNCTNCVSNVSLNQPMEIFIDDTQDCESYTHIHAQSTQTSNRRTDTMYAT